MERDFVRVSGMISVPGVRARLLCYEYIGEKRKVERESICAGDNGDERCR